MKGYVLKDDEYINPADGLVWCKRCHTPRQVRKSYGIYTLSPLVPCTCQLAEWEKERQERKAEEFRRYTETLREKGLGWKALQDYRFENDRRQNSVIMGYMRKLADHFDELPASGFLLWGSHGTGKTFAAACMANALIDRGIPVIMDTFSDMANVLAAMVPSDQQLYLKNIFGKRLVCIDDFSIGGESPLILRAKRMIMGRWAKSSHPSIITTSYSISRLKNPENDVEKDFFSILLNGSVPIMCQGPDLHKGEFEVRMKKVENLLK